MPELLNSAVEAAVDRMGDEVDELAGRAKDTGSAAAALVIVLVCMTWGLAAVQRSL
jgi:diacylglycerol kinase (ATP)